VAVTSPGDRQATGIASATIGADRGDTGQMAAPLRILCVCSFNQTRSVLMGALLGSHLASTRTAHRILTAGTEVHSPRPATDRTMRLLTKRGVDVSAHRSRPVDEPLAGGAHLIVTAEPAHVVWITGRWPGLFERTFTLPEIVTLAGERPPHQGEPLDDWLADLGHRRVRALDYLDDDATGEIADPTGQAPSVWNTSFATVDDLTARLAPSLSRVIAPARGTPRKGRSA
jgi:protein-tyrosine phosphatase